MSSDPAERVARILAPYVTGKIDQARETGTRFVQYTTAEAALAMLKSREVWMRNASCMNDYSEMRFGLERVLEAYASPPGQQFQAALNSIHSGFTDELKNRFDPLAPAVLEHTYLTCLSEHRDDEDDHGRLSMWRAYGGASGVAIVMNNKPFVSPSNALNAWTSPVAYVRGTEFIQQLERVTEAIEAEASFLANISRELLVEAVARTLIFAAVSMKHVGFDEEREWRVVYMPHVAASTRLVEDHVAIRGIPQPIFKIPLVNYPDEGFTGAEPHELINRIIIGPTQYPIAVRSSLLARLYDLKVPDPQEKVVISGIPLRC